MLINGCSEKTQYLSMYFDQKTFICSHGMVFFFFFQVLINNGFTPEKDDYEFCTKVENMIIPSMGYFGISAATGGLAGLRTKSRNCTLLLFKCFCRDTHTLFLSFIFKSILQTVVIFFVGLFLIVYFYPYVLHFFFILKLFFFVLHIKIP